jgi:hypothetical protein
MRYLANHRVRIVEIGALLILQEHKKTKGIIRWYHKQTRFWRAAYTFEMHKHKNTKRIIRGKVTEN